MLFGLLARQERWGLTLRGWIVAVLSVVAFGLLFAFGAHPFLALNHRVASDFLVVEGWIPDTAIHAAADEFRVGNYRLAFSTGGSAQRGATHISTTLTAAEIGAIRLRRAGLPSDSVKSIPSLSSSRDRTYHSAVALRDWFETQHIPVRSLNIVTEDVHARRTRLLFSLAFGHDVAVGVIAVPNPDYDGDRWWRSSAGVRGVLGEAIAYVYTKFFFHPASPPPPAAVSS